MLPKASMPSPSMKALRKARTVAHSSPGGNRRTNILEKSMFEHMHVVNEVGTRAVWAVGRHVCGEAHLSVSKTVLAGKGWGRKNRARGGRA